MYLQLEMPETKGFVIIAALPGLLDELKAIQCQFNMLLCSKHADSINDTGQKFLKIVEEYNLSTLLKYSKDTPEQAGERVQNCKEKNLDSLFNVDQTGVIPDLQLCLNWMDLFSL